MLTQTQLEGPTQPHERLGIWQGGRLCTATLAAKRLDIGGSAPIVTVTTSPQGSTTDGGPVEDFIDPVQAGGSAVDPWDRHPR